MQGIPCITLLAASGRGTPTERQNPFINLWVGNSDTHRVGSLVPLYVNSGYRDIKAEFINLAKTFRRGSHILCPCTLAPPSRQSLTDTHGANCWERIGRTDNILFAPGHVL